MSEIAEHISIENFAGIERLDLEVRPFTVLIGPQSVGKSVVAKLLYFFRSIGANLYLAAFKEYHASAEEELLTVFETLFPFQIPLKGTTTITYSYTGKKLTLHSNPKARQLTFTLPAELSTAFIAFQDYLANHGIVEQVSIGESNAIAAFSGLIQAFLPDFFSRPWFVPSSRALYAHIQADMAAYFQSSNLDPYLTEFGKFLERLKRSQQMIEQLVSSPAAERLLEQILSGSWFRRDGKEYIKSKDDRELPPRLWSSGQQEAQPLTLVLKQFCVGASQPTTLFIEEPEAHLFPASQRDMTELMALAFKGRQPGMRMFVTTHSPYILTTLNNLIMAGQLYDKGLGANAAPPNLVSRDRALPDGCVAAYYMTREDCRSIVDPETGLIGENAIEEISGALTEQFDELLQLDAANG